RPAFPGPAVQLHRPDLEQLRNNDPPFARVHEARRSVREYDDAPITDRQLGEFLYRVGRAKECHAAEVTTPCGPVRMDFAPRPYPGGGALYELELWVAVQACAGLAPGLYRYDSAGHRLEASAGRPAEVGQLWADAGGATGIPAGRLQILLI